MGTTAADRTRSSVLVAAALFSVLACGGSSSPAPDTCAVFHQSAGSVPAGCPGGVTCLPAAP
jgi:hypothetical protein